MKRLLLLLSMVLALSVASYAADITVDLSKDSGAPNSESTSESTATREGVDFTFYNSKQNTGYLMIYPQGYIKFAPHQAIQKVTVTTTGGSSTSVTVQLSKDDVNIGNAVTLNQHNADFSFEIPAANQGADAEYKLTVTNDKKAQLTKIVLTLVDGGTVLADAGLSFPEASYNATLGEEFTQPVLTKATDAAESYESSNLEVATVDATTGAVRLVAAGTTTITARTPATETYAAGSAFYELTVIDPNVEMPAYTCFFNSTTFSKIVNAYDKSWTNTCDGKTYSIANFNNNNSWEWIKCGKTDMALVASIATDFSIPEAIGKVVVTIDDIQENNVNSIKLLYADNAEYTNATEISAAPAQGDLIFNISAPALNCYYKVEFDCKGVKAVARVSKLQYFATEFNPDLLPANLSFAETAYEAVLGEAFTAPIPTCDSDGAITYTSSNEEVATVDATTGAVMPIAAGTTTITAESAETATYNKGTASYTLTVVKGVSSLADAIATGEGVDFKVLVPLTVTYHHSNHTYVTDGTTPILIYGSAPDYAVGAVIPAGWTASFENYRGVPELKPVGSLPTSTETADVTYPVVKEVTTADVNKVVVLKGINLTSNTSGTLNGTTYTLKNMFNVTAQTGIFNLTAAVNIANSTDLQLLPISYDEFVFPTVTIKFDGNEETKTATVTMTIAGEETADINYQFVPSETAAAPARAAAEGYTLYTEPFQVSNIGTINYYVSVDGVDSNVTQQEVTMNDLITSGVEDIIVDAGSAAEYYDLSGRRVENPSTGIYIRRTAGKAVKVFIR